MREPRRSWRRGGKWPVTDTTTKNSHLRPDQSSKSRHNQFCLGRGGASRGKIGERQLVNTKHGSDVADVVVSVFAIVAAVIDIAAVVDFVVDVAVVAIVAIVVAVVDIVVAAVFPIVVAVFSIVAAVVDIVVVAVVPVVVVVLALRIFLEF